MQKNKSCVVVGWTADVVEEVQDKTELAQPLRVTLVPDRDIDRRRFPLPGS